MVGEYLREARMRSGLSARVIAAKLGFHSNQLYFWEPERVRVDPRDIRRLQQLYGCGESEIAEALRLRSMPDDPLSEAPTDPLDPVTPAP